MWWLSLWNEGLDPIPLTVVLGGIALAAWTDLKARRIPNALTGPMVAGGLAWAGWVAGFAGLANALAGCAIMALPYVLLFLLAGGGAGDAKLMGAVGAWLGVAHGLIALVAVAAAGILFAVGWAVYRGRGRALLNNLVGTVVGTPPHEPTKMPYGVAIVAGTWAWALGVLVWA